MSTGSCRCEIRIHKPFKHSLFLRVFIQGGRIPGSKPPLPSLEWEKVSQPCLVKLGFAGSYGLWPIVWVFICKKVPPIHLPLIHDGYLRVIRAQREPTKKITAHLSSSSRIICRPHQGVLCPVFHCSRVQQKQSPTSAADLHSHVEAIFTRMAAKQSGAWMLNSLGEHSNPFGYRLKGERERASSGSSTRLPELKKFLLNSASPTFFTNLCCLIVFWPHLWDWKTWVLGWLISDSWVGMSGRYCPVAPSCRDGCWSGLGWKQNQPRRNFTVKGFL